MVVLKVLSRGGGGFVLSGATIAGDTIAFVGEMEG